MVKNSKTFNLVISGVGGQGLITLLNIITEAALASGCDVKTSEIHGLSQRGGSVSVHIRFGKKVQSPMVPARKADLIFVLEFQEALQVAEFASSKSVFLINQYQTPTLSETVSEEQVKMNLKKVAQKIFFIPAATICEKELGTNVVAGIFILGFAMEKKLLPLTKESILEAIKKAMPEKFWDLNIKALNLALK